MDQLELDYLKQQSLHARKIRQVLMATHFGTANTAPKNVLEDLYSDKKLQEDPTPPRKPRIGPEYQADIPK